MAAAPTPTSPDCSFALASPVRGPAFCARGHAAGDDANERWFPARNVSHWLWLLIGLSAVIRIPDHLAEPLLALDLVILCSGVVMFVRLRRPGVGLQTAGIIVRSPHSMVKGASQRVVPWAAVAAFDHPESRLGARIPNVVHRISAKTPQAARRGRRRRRTDRRSSTQVPISLAVGRGRPTARRRGRGAPNASSRWPRTSTTRHPVCVDARRTYAVAKRITDRTEAQAACRAVLDVLRPVVARAVVDAYSDYRAEMPPEIAAVEAKLREMGRQQDHRDPGMGIEVALDEDGWHLVRRYAPWSINVELCDDTAGASSGRSTTVDTPSG